MSIPPSTPIRLSNTNNNTTLGANTVRIRIEITLSSDVNLFTGEYDPILYCYMSKHLDPLSESIRVRNVSRDIRGGTRRIVDLECTNTPPSVDSAYASVGFYMLCVTGIMPPHTVEDDQALHGRSIKYDRYTPIAGGILNLGAFMQSAITKETLKLEMVDHCMTESKVTRMVMQVRTLSCEIGKGVKLHNSQSSPALWAQRDQAMRRSILREKDLYTKNVIKPSIRDCDNMLVCTYNTEISGKVIPACAFAMVHNISNLTVSFVCNLLRTSISLDRNCTEEFFIETVTSMTTTTTGRSALDFGRINKVCKVMSQTFSLYPNTCDYLPDHCMNVEVERFIHITYTCSGDCEDLCRFAYALAVHCRQYLQPVDGVDSPKDVQLFRALKTLLQLYVPCMVRGVATTAAYGSEDKQKQQQSAILLQGDDDDSLICHFYATLIPRKWFLKKAFGSAPLSPVSTQTPEQDLENNKSQARSLLTAFLPFIPAVEGNDSDNNDDNNNNTGKLPMLIVECTNFCVPLVGHLQMYLNTDDEAQRRELDETGEMISIRRALEKKEPVLRNLSVVNHNTSPYGTSFYDRKEESFSGFFRRPIALWTSMPLLWGENVMAYSVGYGSQRSGRPDDGYGVDFRDWVSMHPGVTFRKLVEFDDSEIAFMTNTISQEPPVIMPNRFSSDDHKRTVVRTINDKHNLVYNDLARLRAKLGTVPPRGTPYLQYLTNAFEKVTPSIISAFARQLSVKDSLFIGFDFIVHPINTTSDLYLVEMKLFYKHQPSPDRSITHPK